MKKFITFFLLSGLILLSFFGCNTNQNIPESLEKDVSKENALSEDSINSHENSKEQSGPRPEEVYPFLKSKYKVTSIMNSFEKLYVCEYYFVDGYVVGAKLMTTLQTEEDANEYYNIIIDEFEDAVLSQCTVTHFLDDDDNFYYGYSLEKLKFVLERTGYEIGMNFDEEEFNEKFYRQKTAG